MLCALPILPPRFSRSPGTRDLVVVSLILPFPECHDVGIIQHVSPLDWLHSLSSMHYRFIHVRNKKQKWIELLVGAQGCQMQLPVFVLLHMLFLLPEYPCSHCVLIRVLQGNSSNGNKIYVYTEIYTYFSLPLSFIYF